MKSALIRDDVVHTFNDIDFARVWPVGFQRLPSSRPRRASLGHVADIEATQPVSVKATPNFLSPRVGVRGRRTKRKLDIHGNVGGVSLHATYPDTVASRSAGIERRCRVCAHDECIPRCEGQVVCERSSLVYIIYAAIRWVCNSFVFETREKACADEVVAQGICSTQSMANIKGEEEEGL